MRPITMRTESALWLVSAILALVAARGWAGGFDSDAGDPPATPAAPGALLMLDNDSLAAAADYAAEHDPFRLARRPSDVPYIPGIESAPPPQPAPPKPVLLLTGILGGPPWQGVVEGFPGARGSTVVRAGQRVGDLDVVQVTRDAVVVEGADTTWTLRVRRAW